MNTKVLLLEGIAEAMLKDKEKKYQDLIVERKFINDNSGDAYAIIELDDEYFRIDYRITKLELLGMEAYSDFKLKSIKPVTPKQVTVTTYE